MPPLNGDLTESEIRRYGAMSGECPVELATQVIGGLFDLLRKLETANAPAGSCSCHGGIK